MAYPIRDTNGENTKQEIILNIIITIVMLYVFLFSMRSFIKALRLGSMHDSLKARVKTLNTAIDSYNKAEPHVIQSSWFFIRAGWLVFRGIFIVLSGYYLFNLFQ